MKFNESLKKKKLNLKIPTWLVPELVTKGSTKWELTAADKVLATSVIKSLAIS